MATWSHLRHLSWPELRHQPWRHLTALLAVMLGVALAFSVHLINESALSEFSAAVRQVNGQADFELRAQQDGFDETLYDRVSQHPQVDLASPVIDFDTLVINGDSAVPVRLLGLDAFVAPALNLELLPQVASPAERLAMLQPDAVFLNDSARSRLGNTVRTVQVLRDQGRLALQVRGRVALQGEPVMVMDIAAVQMQFGWLGRLSRIDVRLRPGADREQTLRELALPPGVRAVTPQAAAQRVSNLSRAYRVNLTVLALVALFTGSFLVFSVLSLSVARRTAQFALLGVLGLSARERLRMVVAESAVLGGVGSAIGLALGTALAKAALYWLSGDLGGGYFPGVAPALHFSFGAAALYGGLGVAAAVVGGWLPARMAQRLAPAQALKGLGGHADKSQAAWVGPALLVLGTVLAAAPPIGGVPLAAYGSVACLLLGGIACVPAGVAALLTLLHRGGGTQARQWMWRHPLALLATSRARHQRHTATIAVAGVVASLALSVALTVMVASFRHAVIDWLDTVLPADLYVRAHAGASSDNVFVPRELTQAASQLPGVARVETQRVLTLQLDPAQPAVTLIARPLPDPARNLPLVGAPLPPLLGEVNVYVSEAMVSLYGAQVGQPFTLPLPGHPAQRVQVRGVWRDYARQSGCVMMAAADFERLSADTRVNDLALWLQPGVSAAEVQSGVREVVRQHSGGDEALLEFASPGEIRAVSLRIFDRSFAVTYWLQAVAIGIGLFGVAASFSAQVLARRKEFGLLSHLGLTRRQILTLVAGEGAVWSATGTLLGLALGLAVSVVLVKVVNPQSFHWTMDLAPPWLRLGVLCVTVLVAGTFTAWHSARGNALRGATRAVREDW